MRIYQDLVWIYLNDFCIIHLNIKNKKKVKLLLELWMTFNSKIYCENSGSIP